MAQTEEELGSGIPPVDVKLRPHIMKEEGQAVRLAVVVNSCDFTKTSAILPYANCNINNSSMYL